MDSDDRHPAYDRVDARKTVEGRDKKQPGDPYKGAEAFYELAVMEKPPRRCVLVSNAYKIVG